MAESRRISLGHDAEALDVNNRRVLSVGLRSKFVDCEKSTKWISSCRGPVAAFHYKLA